MGKLFIVTCDEFSFAKAAKDLWTAFKRIEQNSDFTILTDITGCPVSAAKVVKHVERRGVYDMDRVIPFGREIDLVIGT